MYETLFRQKKAVERIGNSYVSIFAPELWPDVASGMNCMSAISAGFWWASGWRNFQGSSNFKWGFDVDAGPIIAGFSPAANVRSCRRAVNGRLITPGNGRSSSCRDMASA